jgi:hypothetical protein
MQANHSTHDDGLMWVRLMHWMIADGEPRLPNVDSLLTGVGLRVRGEVTAATPDSPDGIVEAKGRHPHEVMYRLTGRAGEPTDFDVDTGQALPTPGWVVFPPAAQPSQVLIALRVG